jgi:hypothetical protein
MNCIHHFHICLLYVEFSLSNEPVSNKSRDNSFIIDTRLRAELPGFNSQHEQWWEFSFTPLHPHRLRGLPSLLSNGYRGLLSGGKAAGASNWLFTSCSAEVNSWSYTSTPHTSLWRGAWFSPGTTLPLPLPTGVNEHVGVTVTHLNCMRFKWRALGRPTGYSDGVFKLLSFSVTSVGIVLWFKPRLESSKFLCAWRRMGWTEHVAWMVRLETRTTNLTYKKRELERPRRRWKETIKLNLKWEGCIGFNCIYFARGKI